MDILSYLARADKWFVCGGRSSIYAPPTPTWDETPGFWDEVHLGRTALPRLFTVLVLDERGRPLPLRFQERHWRPDRLRQTYSAPDLEIFERKVNLPEDAFISHLTLRNRADRPRTLHLLQWSWQPRQAEGSSVVEAEVREGRLSYRLRLPEEPGWTHHERLDLYVILGGDRPAASWTINLTEEHGPQPQWRYSVAPEKFRDGRLPGERQIEVGVTETRRGPQFPAGNLHLLLHYPIDLPPGGEATLALGGALGFTAEHAERGWPAIALDAPERSEAQWRAYFAGVPDFRCEDPYLQKYYWYRWYQLRAHQVDMRFGGFQHPCVVEGIGGFRQQISYSAHCHMRECQWQHDPAFAWGSLLNMLANQYPNGRTPGHVNERGCRGEAASQTGWVSFYHANWGNVWQLYQIHGDRERLAAAYAGLVRYAEYFQRERDPEGSFLYDVLNQGETGQEYMSRYQAVHPHADDWGPLRLKGVDSTFYLYELYGALARMARELGRPAAEAERWESARRRCGAAVREQMWDPETQIFSDVDPATGRRTGVKALVCFYPFMSDLATAEHLPALRRHLLNPGEFWTSYPFPSTSVDDPQFSAAAEWKGKRTNCPWNGRVWPMTNSHACEALAEAARRLDPSLGEAAVEALRRFVQLMFFEGDGERPNTFEHYNPFTGQACEYRGVDDYQHSWVNDLILKYLCGITPLDGNRVQIHPLPAGLAFSVAWVRIKGHWLAVRHEPGRAFVVEVDGQERHRSPGLERVELEL